MSVGGGHKEFVGDLRMTRVMTTDPEGQKRPIRLTITDQASRLEVVEVRLSEEEVGRLLTGSATLSYDDTEGPAVEVRAWDFMGKTHEHQSQEFRRPGVTEGPSAQEQADAWGAQMKAEGWDTYASHRTNRASVVATVRRYV